MKKFTFFILLSIFLGCLHLTGNAQWQQVTGYPPDGNANSMMVIRDTMVVSSSGNGYDMTPGLFRSGDHGKTWSAKDTSLGTSAYPLIVDGTLLLAGTVGSGVYASPDLGKHWTSRNSGLPAAFGVFDLDPASSGLYVCGDGGIFRSADTAETWVDISYPGTIQAYSAVTAGDTIITSFVTQSIAGVYRSTDNGAGWAFIDNSSGMTDRYITKFAKFNNAMFAASNGDFGSGNVFVSTDSGINWTAAGGLDDHGHNYPRDFLFYNATIFLATGKGVYKSVDNGLNWSNTGCTNVESLAIAGDTLYAGTGYQGIWKRGLAELIGSVDEIQKDVSFMVCPNPSSDIIHITLKPSLVTRNNSISICDILGKEYIRKQFSSDKITFDVRLLPDGVYMVKLANQRFTEVARFVKN